MKKAGCLILMIAWWILAPFPVGAEVNTCSGPDGQVPGYVPGELLVKFRAANRKDAIRSYLEQWRIKPGRSFRIIGADSMRLPPGMTVEDALELFHSDPAVVYAEPNFCRRADVLPSDEHFDLVWGLHNTGQVINETPGTFDADIDAPEAWEVTTGSSEVVVAVIDSGLDFSHPDLAGNVWINQGEAAAPSDGVDNDGNGYVDDVRGWDFISGDNAPLPNDPGGHGTHVAGTIAASGNDDRGIPGVSWHAKIMSLRTLDAFGSGDTAAAILAFEYATLMGADIINCSWGGAGYSQALKDAIDASNALVVCSAGNWGVDTDTLPHYPASYTSPNIISVAATDAHDDLSPFSNYGIESVDVAAPGVNIYSCAPSRRTLWSDDFDDGDLEGWNSGGPRDNWGITNSESFSEPFSLADSPDGLYSQRTNAWIRTPVLDLSGAWNTILEFKIKGQSELGVDFLKVEVSTDGSIWLWKPVKLSHIGIVAWISGQIPGWTGAMVDLSDYDGLPTLYVRFLFLTDWETQLDGWYIDDVAVTAASSYYDGTEYGFRDGTSMAAPYVSGIAALVRAENPLLTAVGVKTAIGETVDLKPALDGTVGYGGRVNASGAVTKAHDADNDGIPESVDNCTAVANADQRDTDGDGYGNLCDGDLNNDGYTNTIDLQLFKLAYGTHQGDPDYNPDADFDGNASIDSLDLDIYKGLHRLPPGP